MARPLAVFDIDGTLVDSRAIIQAATEQAFGRMGLDAPAYEQTRKVVGLGLAESLAILAPELDARGHDELTEHYKQVFLSLRADPQFHEPLYEGAAETLARLEKAGWRIAMATGKSRRGVDSILAMHAWHDLFHSCHCAEDGLPKPHPAMLHAAMAALDAQPEETVMIGDSTHDMKMAGAAGVYAQGVSWGFCTREEVLSAGAHHCADSFAELDAALERFGDA
jgi:phosphoglycolate phosphatase